MTEIVFWKDKKEKKVDPRLFSTKAEALAKKFKADHDASRSRTNKRTQVRKFYDEVLRLEMLARTRPEDWDDILPLIHMLTAKAAYAKGRNLVSDGFLDFIRDSVEQVSAREDLAVFTNFFEAFMGFYRQHGPAN